MMIAEVKRTEGTMINKTNRFYVSFKEHLEHSEIKRFYLLERKKEILRERKRGGKEQILFLL